MSVSANMRSKVLQWHDRGVDVTATAKLLGITEAEVIDIINHPNPVKPRTDYGPEFLEPLF